MENNFVNKLYKTLKSGQTVEDTLKRTKLTRDELEVGISLLERSGKHIGIINKNGVEYISKRYKSSFLYPKNNPLELFHELILVVSDTHYGNKVCQPSLVNRAYQKAYDLGVKTALHVGDLLDGDYVKIRPEQQYQLFAHGYDEQTDYFLDMYPEVEGITTYFIQGSHDETHIKNGGADPAKKFVEKRKDFVYLGQDNGIYSLGGNVDIMLSHPGGGCADSLSYKPQKAIENMTPGNKPKILLVGHYHKYYYMNYRNVHAFEVPCLCGQSQFMAKMGLDNVMGALFLDVHYDKLGNVHFIDVDEMMFNSEDYVPNDYQRARKLVIKR